MKFPLAACTLLALALPAAARPLLAQSGSPAPMVPKANPDPRLAAIHAKATAVHAPGQVAISPDGALVAYTVRQREGSTLHLIAALNPDPAKERLIAPNGETACSNSAPVWSPNSQTLAFTSSCTTKEQQPGQSQIFLWSRATGEVHQLTHLKGLFQQAAFSPDGKTLAFLFVENATRSAGALAAMTPWSGVIGQDHVEIQRVYAVATSNGSGAFLTPANLHVYEFSWNPVDAAITYIAANPPGENNWWVAQLFVEPVSTVRSWPCSAQVAKAATTDGLTVWRKSYSTQPRRARRYTACRSRCRAGLARWQAHCLHRRPDERPGGSTGGDVWVVPDVKSQLVKNAVPVDVTPGIDGTPCWLRAGSTPQRDRVRGRPARPRRCSPMAWDVNTKKA